MDYVDKHYATHTDKTQRAITGLSMGGFGALYIGIKNQDRFGNIGSMSGGVNIEQYKNNWGISAVVNSNWQDYNIKISLMVSFLPRAISFLTAVSMISLLSQTEHYTKNY